MNLPIHAELPPLRVDEGGAVRVGPSRVTLVTVIEAYRDGATPEEIVLRFPTLDLADVYGVLAYYLRNREAVESFLDESDRNARELRQKIEAHQGAMPNIRQRLLERKRAAEAQPVE